MATTTPTVDEGILVADMLAESVQHMEDERERISQEEEGDTLGWLAEMDRLIQARKDMMDKFAENSFSFGRV